MGLNDKDCNFVHTAFNEQRFLFKKRNKCQQEKDSLTKEDVGRPIKMEFRTIEKLVGITWTFIEFEELKLDDVFRMFEKDKSPVKDINGETVFMALSLPRPCEPTGNFVINLTSSIDGKEFKPDTDSGKEYVKIQCQECGTELYNTKLTISDFRGRKSNGSDFITIGQQPRINNGFEIPSCHSCGAKWIGYDNKNVLSMSTSVGIISG